MLNDMTALCIASSNRSLRILQRTNHPSMPVILFFRCRVATIEFEYRKRIAELTESAEVNSCTFVGKSSVYSIISKAGG